MADLRESPGSVSLDECWFGVCRCGYCAVCGYPKHCALHGPVFGDQPGGKPYDHAYVECPYAIPYYKHHTWPLSSRSQRR